MIQDILPRKYDNTYHDGMEPKDDSICFSFINNLVLIGHEPVREGEGRYIPKESSSSLEKEIPEGDIVYPSYGQIKEQVTEYRYLFKVGEEEFYLVKLDCEDAQKEFEVSADGIKLVYRYENYKAHRHCTPKYRVFAQMTAYHLFLWYRDNAFCGRCGKPMIHHDKLRAVKCTCCNNLVFPRISPAVIVGVHDGKRLLMTRYNGRDYKGYALIAGFIEIGESAEATVRREVMEEVGINVGKVTYFGSQPWGMDGGFLLGYYAELDGDAKINLDREELSMAGWYEPDEITVEDDDISLTSCMIANWKNNIARK